MEDKLANLDPKPPTLYPKPKTQNPHLDAAQGVLKWPEYSIITTKHKKKPELKKNLHLDAGQNIKKKHEPASRCRSGSAEVAKVLNYHYQPYHYQLDSISMPLRAQYWNGTSNEIITTNILLLCAWAVPSVVIIAITAAKGFFGLCLSKKKVKKNTIITATPLRKGVE